MNDYFKIKSLDWKYSNNYGFIAQAETPFGYYTIASDEDRCGEPLFLEFHLGVDEFCTKYSQQIEVECDQEDLESFQQAAQADYEQRIQKSLEVLDFSELEKYIQNQAYRQASEICFDVSDAGYKRWNLFGEMISQGVGDGAGKCGEKILQLVQTEEKDDTN